MTPAQFALRWVLDHPAVSTVIPGGKKPEQVADNAAASSLDPLGDETMDRIAEIYEQYAAPHVHHRW